MLYQQYFGEQIKKQINDSIVQTQNALDSQLNALKANSDIFARSIVLNRYLLTEDENIRFNVMHRVLLKEFAAFMAVHPEYLEVSLIMPDGYEEVSSVNQGGINVTDEEVDTHYFKNIVESTSNIEINTFINPDTGKWALIAARKIFQQNTIEQSSSSEKIIKGYLIIKTSFDFISKSFKDNSLISSGFAVIHNAKGISIVNYPVHQLEFNGQLKILNDKKYSNSSQTSTWLLNDKAYYLVGQRKLMDNLFLTLGWSKSELNPLLKNIAYTTMQYSLIIIILSSFLLFWVLNKQLIIPILKLSLAARKMGHEGTWVFQSKSKDELNDLANTINEMGKSLIKQKQKVHDIAYIDSLTQLPNRRQFTDDLEYQYGNADDVLPNIALLFIDLDGFKEINDTSGHAAGDQLLILVANRLNNVLRASDKVSTSTVANHHIARLGGDEFTIILKGVQDRNAAAQVSQRILKAFSRAFKINDRDFLIGTSIGIALATECGESAVELLKNADSAMYEAKKNGKNTYSFYNKSAALKSLKHIEMKEELRRAIDNNELSLVYQPQINIESGEMVGCEALIRWKNPSKGWIPPNVFIPIAEASGLILSLGRWVLLEACHQMKQWQLMGYAVVPVWVNVSNIQLNKEDMHEVIMACLKETGLSKNLLGIEITESSIMQGAESIVQLEKIQSAGINIALDDFGTGYSSLSALRGLPIDKLKIDKSFITDLNSDDGQTIVAAIIAMAHQLHLKVVAEGVEKAEELMFLKQKKVDIIQGFYFSKPLPANDFIKKLNTIAVHS